MSTWKPPPSFSACPSIRPGSLKTGKLGFVAAKPIPQVLRNINAFTAGVVRRVRAGLGYGELQQAVTSLAGTLSETPGMGFPISSYQSNVPQLSARIDRSKAKMQGVTMPRSVGSWASRCSPG